MEWKLFADLAELAGGKRIAVDAGPGDTVGEALEALLESHPALEQRVLDEDGELEDHINLLRNGSNVFTQEGGLGTELEAGDELALFPPVSGGSAPR
jgi:sulfur-carrier protein